MENNISNSGYYWSNENSTKKDVRYFSKQLIMTSMAVSSLTFFSNTTTSKTFAQNQIINNISSYSWFNEESVNPKTTFYVKSENTSKVYPYTNLNNWKVNDKEVLDEEMILMQKEILNPIIQFENIVLKISFFLAIIFTILSLPIFLGFPAIIGIIMNLGLFVFIKLRKWERGE